MSYAFVLSHRNKFIIVVLFLFIVFLVELLYLIAYYHNVIYVTCVKNKLSAKDPVQDESIWVPFH